LLLPSSLLCVCAQIKLAPQIKLAERLKNSLANIWILYFNLRIAYITPQKSQGRKRGDIVDFAGQQGPLIWWTKEIRASREVDESNQNSLKG
jgi:hypothetical protein